MWKGTGDEGIEVADKMVMTSGLSSALSWSDINGLSREMLHMTSNTPHEQTGKRSVNEVSPGSHKNNYRQQAIKCFLSLLICVISIVK